LRISGSIASSPRSKKLALALHDATGDFDQGFVADLEAAHQPARFLQLGAQHRVVGGSRHQIRVGLIDAHARHGRLIDLDDPAVFGAAHENVGNDVLGLGRS
jgi:hypothetical protein